jgi:hypothetical protein
MFGAVRFAWSVTFDAVHDFIWGDLKEGVLDLRGLALPVRALVWLGFTLLLVAIGGLLVADHWRVAFDLVTLTQGIPGRGRLVPTALLPATMFLLALAWSFVLAGALRARRAIRLTTLILYGLTFISSFDSQLFTNLKALSVAVGALVGLLIMFGLSWRMRPRPAIEFLLILVLVGSASAVLQAEGLASWRLSGLPLIASRVHLDVTGLTALITPLLLLVGMGVAGFAAKLAGWGVAITEDRLPKYSSFVLIVTALGWQVWQVLGATIDRFQQGAATESYAMLNAFGVLLIVGVCWLVVTRLAARRQRTAAILTADEMAESIDVWATPLVVAYTLPVLATYVISASALLVSVTALLLGLGYMGQVMLVNLLGTLGSASSILGWHVAVDTAAVVGGVWLARAGQRAPALFLGTYGLMDLKSELSGDGQILAPFTSPISAQRADVWWTLILLGAALLWLARGRLTERRAGHLLFLTLILMLLGQTDFISNRFSLFGFGGIGFLAFGIVWDALTVGAWANVDSKGLPRTSRIFLYLGYVLLSVAVINWAVVSHDLAAVDQLTGNLGLVGLDRFGRPMLYAIFAVTLTLPWAGPATSEELGIETPDDDPDGILGNGPPVSVAALHAGPGVAPNQDARDQSE